MPSPWPDQPCPYPDRAEHIRDLLAEMVPKDEQVTQEFKLLVSQQPGGSITCPYCQGSLEYASDGESLVVSNNSPMRYSRAKMEQRANDYGSQLNPPALDMTPEEWVAEEKLMGGALHGYTYVEDFKP